MTEVDPKLLSQRLARFLAHSEHRLDKMLAGFTDQQADYIRILPLFFQVNHPLLPGFVDTEVSAGIPGYHPSRICLQIARGLSKSFQYASKAHLRFDILGLYLMGSTGTIGQATSSDLDCWLATRSSLERVEKKRLENKCKKLSEWFLTKGIELNCYLVSVDDFEKQRLSKLLLDEFYRTAVWLAGRKPLWWLVDDNQSHLQQVQRWLSERHVDAADWLDFGPVGPFIAEEFLQAALGQLLKAMQSPFKSVIKLTLLEVYAQQYPQVEPLSQVYKQTLLSGKSLNRLDPYLLLYEYLAEHLNNAAQRVRFLQQAFYLKSGAKIGYHKTPIKNWRWQLMSELVTDWGLSKLTIEKLNRRLEWSVPEIKKIRSQLLVMLNQSYHFLNDFSRIHGIASYQVRQQILTIGRQLYVAFEERENKISCINQGIVPLEQTGEMTIHRVDQTQWQLFSGLISSQSITTREPVYKAKSPIALISWAIINALASADSLFHLLSDVGWPDRKVIQQLQKCLAQFLTDYRRPVGASELLNSEKTDQLLVIGNLHCDPMGWDRLNDVLQVESGDDYHCYGEHHANFFADIAVIRLSSWGQLTLEQYQGDDCLLVFYQKHRAAIGENRARFKLFGGVNPAAVEARLIAMLVKWQQNEQQFNEHHPGFEMQRAGDQFLLLRYSDKLSWSRFPDTAATLADFARQSVRAQAVHFESEYWRERESELPMAIANAGDKSHIACFIWQSKSGNRINRSSDEHWRFGIRLASGHLYLTRHESTSLGQLCAHYQQFFDEQNRLITEASPGCDWWTFYSGQWKQNQLTFVRCNSNLSAQLHDLIQLKAEISSTVMEHSRQSRDRAWRNQIVRFHWIDRLFKVSLAKPVSLIPLLNAVKIARQGGDYPLYISSVSLSDGSGLSMPQAIWIKQELEQILAELVRDLGDTD